MPRKAGRVVRLHDLSGLDRYSEDELLDLREQLIADMQRIEGESAAYGVQLAKLNQARTELQRERADRARGLRAVKHELNRQARGRRESRWVSAHGKGPQ